MAGAIVVGLRERGHDAELVVMTPPPFGMHCDRTVPGYRRRALEGLKAPLRHDVLHFHFNLTFCEYIDAAWGRIAGRPLTLMHFHGDDCRRREVTLAHHPARARIYDASKRNEGLTLRRTRLAGRLCDAAIVGDFELLDQIAPFFRTVYLVPPPLALSRLPFPRPSPSGGAVDSRSHSDDAGPVVLHAPSDPVIKGTETIRRALDAVAAGRPLRPRIVTDLPHDELLHQIAEADVVIDQLNSESSSIFGLEGMALGKPVLSEFRREMLHPLARDTPMIEITPETVGERLERLLDDPDRMARLAERGPRFVAEVHGTDKVAEAVERVYEHARTQTRGFFEVSCNEVRPLVM